MKSYLRSLENEFGESSNAIRIELNRFEEAGMLVSFTEGNKKLFKANTEHPLFHEIHKILMKNFGLDQIVETVINRLGKVERVFLAGDLARGLDSSIIDLIIIGDIDKMYLVNLVSKAETLISRKIRYVIYTYDEFLNGTVDKLNPEPFLIWSKQ